MNGALDWTCGYTSNIIYNIVYWNKLTRVIKSSVAEPRDEKNIIFWKFQQNIWVDHNF